jgi:hypothetical protein
MSVFGEIAKNVGEEVAKGLEKNVAPVVKKAAKSVVDTVEGWGFEPKIGQMSSRDYLDSIDAYKKIVNDKNYTYKSKGKDVKAIEEMQKPYVDHIVKAMDRKIQKNGRGSNFTVENVAKEFADLEDIGVPRKYTGKIFNYTNSYSEQMDIARILKKLNPPERDIYMHFLQQGPKNIYDLGKYVKSYSSELTRPQQETFASMIPQWEGSLADLVEVAKTL